MSNNTKAGQSLAQTVEAEGSGKVTLPITDPGTLEHLKLRIYPGAENYLRLTPQVNRSNGYEDVIALAGKTYIDGDDDSFEWELSKPLREGDELVIRYQNLDTAYEHSFRAVASIDYAGGLTRWVPSALSGVLS